MGLKGFSSSPHLSKSEDAIELEPIKDYPSQNGKGILPPLSFSSPGNFSVILLETDYFGGLAQMMNYLFDLWLPPFLSLPPYPCSSTPLIFHLDLLYQLQWSEGTIYLPSHQCIIFILHCTPLLVLIFLFYSILSFNINLNCMGRHCLFLTTTVIFLSSDLYISLLLPFSSIPFYYSVSTPLLWGNT